MVLTTRRKNMRINNRHCSTISNDRGELAAVVALGFLRPHTRHYLAPATLKAHLIIWIRLCLTAEDRFFRPFSFRGSPTIITLIDQVEAYPGFVTDEKFIINFTERVEKFSAKQLRKPFIQRDSIAIRINIC